jgi:cytochrome b
MIKQATLAGAPLSVVMLGGSALVEETICPDPRTPGWATTSTSAGEGGKSLHQGAGYVVLALVAMRLIWGCIGSRHARFRDLVLRPKRLLAYLKSRRSGRPRRYLGPDPAGGAMIVLLLDLLILTGGSGWLITTDAFWGIAWLEDLHKAVANLTVVLVFAHVAGVVFSSVAHRENLVLAMIIGRKRAEPG